ncbi:MAG TPA: hypothetical protein VM575_19890 [Nocardioides sp.]|nr:hypothetical protein [Nocardioides sp.]
MTQTELDEIVRVAAVRTWRTIALSLVVGMGFLAVVVGPSRGWDLSAALVFGALVMLAWSWLSTRRSARRMLAASFPVGSTVAAEATDEALVLHTGLGSADVLWSRFTRPKAGPVFVTAKDSASRQWLMVPRQLFPDAWVAYVERPVGDA